MNPISGLIAYALIAALVGAAAFGALQTGRLWYAHSQTAEAQKNLSDEKADRAAVEADRERLARKYTTEREAREVAHAAETQKLLERHQQEEKQRDAVIAAMQLGANKLQQQIDEFTATRTGGNETDPAACSYYRDRLATTGKLLNRTYRFAARITGEAEKRTSQARLLKEQLLADRTACTE